MGVFSTHYTCESSGLKRFQLGELLTQVLLDCASQSKEDQQRHKFWQRDPLAIEMYDRFIFQQKLEYVHLNPLHARWNLADRPENYYWSSAGFYETEIDDFGFLTHYMDRF